MHTCLQLTAHLCDEYYILLFKYWKYFIVKTFVLQRINAAIHINIKIIYIVHLLFYLIKPFTSLGRFMFFALGHLYENIIV